MSDIELVIKINKKAYNALTRAEFDANLVINEMRKAIVNGIPLPKGHGDLIDADYEVSTDGRTVYDVCGYLAPTIIEADEVESEGGE